MELYFQVPFKFAHRGIEVRKYNVGLHTVDDPELIEAAQRLGYATTYPKVIKGYFVASPIWPGTVAIVATGASLVKEDVDHLRTRCRVIAVNDAYKLAPWADILYASDPEWWEHHQGVKEFPGLRITRDRNGGDAAAAKWGLLAMKINHNGRGFSADPAVLHSGNNSGFQGMNLARLMGGTRLLLLGFDMKGQTHFFGDHPTIKLKRKHNYPLWLRRFDEILVDGFEVINCTPGSAIERFKRLTVREALP